MKLKDVIIKKTPVGLIIEKSAREISFKGRSGELIKKVLEQEFKNSSSVNSLLGQLLSSIEQPAIADSFKEKLSVIKSKKIALFLSQDKIAKKLLEFFNLFNFKRKEVFNLEEKENVSVLRRFDYLVIYHNRPYPEVLSSLNEFALKNNIWFARAFREGNRFIIAPLVIPYETACYQCYSFLKTNNQIYDYDTLEEGEIIMGEITELPEVLSSFCANLFFLKIIYFFGENRHQIEQLDETVLDLNSLKISYNPVLKLPNCPACNINSRIQDA